MMVRVQSLQRAPFPQHLLQHPSPASSHSHRVATHIAENGAGCNIYIASGVDVYCAKIKEEDLLRARQVGEVIKVSQDSGHKAYDSGEFLKVAFEKVGAVSTQSITKQRKAEQPAVQAELERQIYRLKSIKEAAFLSGK